MSQDPSMNTAILHFATQVATAASPSTSRAEGSALPANATTNTEANASATSAAVPPGRIDGDYSWLKEALATVESPERRVKRLLQQIEELVGVPVHPDFICKPEETSTASPDGNPRAADQDDAKEEKLIDALEELSDMVEDINWAAEFGLMQGPSRMLQLLARALPSSQAAAATEEGRNKAESDDGSADDLVKSSADVRRGLALVIAHSAQLNENIQQGYATHRWESVLVPLLAKEIERNRSSAVSAAVLHACSCLCRENDANTAVFVQRGGLTCLADILHLEPGRPSASAKVLGRTLFFLSYLAQAGVSAEAVLRLTCVQIEFGANPATDGAHTVVTTTTASSPPGASIIATTSDNTLTNDETAAPAHADNEEVQRAAALFLLNAFRKAPDVVKKTIRECMPRRWEQWKQQMQRGDDSDYRAQLVDAVEKVG